MLTSTFFFINTYTTPLTPEENMKALYVQLEHTPDDPIINYNMGNTLYNLQQYDQAQHYFQQALDNSDDSSKINFQALFFLGACSYKKTLDLLGPDFENNENPDTEKLSRAIQEIDCARKMFKRAIMFSFGMETPRGDFIEKYENQDDAELFETAMRPVFRSPSQIEPKPECNLEADWKTLRALIKKFETEQFPEKNFSLYETQYPWFLGMSWLLLLTQWILR